MVPIVLATAAILVGSVLLMGFIGLLIEGHLVSYLETNLLSTVNVEQMYSQWLVSQKLVGMILVIGVAGLGIYLYILDQGGAQRGQSKQFLERIFKIALLTAASFIIYNFLTEFSALLSQFILQTTDKSFEAAFPTFQTGKVTALDVVTGKIAAEKLWHILLRGIYTLGIIFLAFTIAIRNTIVLVGTALFPIGITLSYLPFSISKNMGKRIVNITVIAIFLQVLDVFILTVGLTYQLNGINQVAVFWAAAIINWGFIQQSLTGTLTQGLNTVNNAKNQVLIQTKKIENKTPTKRDRKVRLGGEKRKYEL